MHDERHRSGSPRGARPRRPSPAWLLPLLLAACADDESPNRPPEDLALSASADSVVVGGTARLVAAAVDPDGDRLETVWSDERGRLGSGDTLRWTAPARPGPRTIVCRVDDGRGGELADSLTLDVFFYPAYEDLALFDLDPPLCQQSSVVFHEPTAVALEDQTGLDGLWNGQAPDFDFEQGRLLAVFWGCLPAGGTNCFDGIERAVLVDDTVRVLLRPVSEFDQVFLLTACPQRWAGIEDRERPLRFVW